MILRRLLQTIDRLKAWRYNRRLYKRVMSRFRDRPDIRSLLLGSGGIDVIRFPDIDGIIVCIALSGLDLRSCHRYPDHLRGFLNYRLGQVEDHLVKHLLYKTAEGE